MKREVVYIADLDQDIDDVVAAHYLHKEDVLKCVVCDPYPKSKEGLERKDKLEKLGVEVQKKDAAGGKICVRRRRPYPDRKLYPDTSYRLAGYERRLCRM